MHMKVVIKVDVKNSVKETKKRALECEPHTMCPKCLRGRG